MIQPPLLGVVKAASAVSARTVTWRVPAALGAEPLAGTETGMVRSPPRGRNSDRDTPEGFFVWLE
jgi:hypothetical protein